ncbi:MAG: phosphatidate cytidylyltransferase, partial [Allopontixanthobacter sediminis]
MPPANGTAKGASDLLVRLISAAVMLALAGTAFYFGGTVLDTFIGVVALIAFVELVLLIVKATGNISFRLAAILAGAAYIFVAAGVLAQLESYYLIAVLGVVIATDTGGYLFGRTIGGPKIARRISPSKTWAGLIGAMLCAGLWLYLSAQFLLPARLDATWEQPLGAAIVGAVLAVIAQIGDFFESWLKRKAGVK